MLQQVVERNGRGTVASYLEKWKHAILAWYGPLAVFMLPNIPRPHHVSTCDLKIRISACYSSDLVSHPALIEFVISICAWLQKWHILNFVYWTVPASEVLAIRDEQSKRLFSNRFNATYILWTRWVNMSFEVEDARGSMDDDCRGFLVFGGIENNHNWHNWHRLLHISDICENRYLLESEHG